jgi:hypothetical protein
MAYCATYYMEVRMGHIGNPLQEIDEPAPLPAVAPLPNEAVPVEPAAVPVPA